jgi:hypothetical protein
MPWTERLCTATLEHIECHKTSSSTYTVLLQPPSDTPCSCLSGVAFALSSVSRPWMSLLHIWWRLEDVTIIDFLFSVLRASLGCKQVYWSRAMICGMRGTICIIVAFVRGRLSMKRCCRYLWCTKDRTFAWIASCWLWLYYNFSGDWTAARNVAFHACLPIKSKAGCPCWSSSQSPGFFAVKFHSKNVYSVGQIHRWR